MQDIGRYYDRNQKWYNLMWADKESLSMHYGIWDKDTASQKEANLNTYKILQDILLIKKGQRILDAGCGIGGASIWIAKQISAAFTGITLSATQIKQAKKNAFKRGVANVTFEWGDYFKTRFESESFDAAFAIESFCYSYPNHRTLYREMHRVLKKGGKLVFFDAFRIRDPKTDQEKKHMKDFNDGYAINDIPTGTEMVKSLKQAGFSKVDFRDFTHSIDRSVRKVDRMGRTFGWLARPLRFARIISDAEVDCVKAIRNQLKVYKKTLGYCILVAVK
jgi:tocopherol O-methyltransferase